MIQNYIENANFEETGFSYALSLISGKYKMIILYCLMEFKVVRFNEMQRYLKKISDKTLSQNLKELERDGLIRRIVYPQIPPKVEYSLSQKGYGGIGSALRMGGAKPGIKRSSALQKPKEKKSQKALFFFGQIGNVLSKRCMAKIICPPYTKATPLFVHEGGSPLHHKFRPHALRTHLQRSPRSYERAGNAGALRPAWHKTLAPG